MKFDFNASPKQYASITYKLNWMTDTLAKPYPNVENFNEFKEARQLIKKIKQDIRNANK